MNNDNQSYGESPEFIRTSLAGAMTLGLKKGLFYRGAELHCLNLLLTYEKGCFARCAYCGLSKKRTGSYEKKSFIRVPWPTYRIDKIIERTRLKREKIKRICISMITNPRAVRDTISLCQKLNSQLKIPISLLITPTLINNGDLEEFKNAGADKVGIAIDLATPELFDKYRGARVGGPHRWEKYWDVLAKTIKIFGKGNGGAHLIVGMGETEKQMCSVIQRVRDLGGNTHLFSFFPEPGSLLETRTPPPIGTYRRVQIARYLMDNDIKREDEFCYDKNERLISFGLKENELIDIIESGEPFRTSGCAGEDGQVACNRPYANSRPGPEIRNYPFPPEREDILIIKKQIGLSFS
jgi:biotin synthase